MGQRNAWITGSAGLIGSHLIQQAADVAPQWNVIALNRRTLELTDFEAVSNRFKEDAPALLIHCAGISDTGQCEREPERAHLVNVEVTAFLTDLFAERRMIFFSTDLVFDGKRGHYREEDAVNPLNRYAKTKVEAETRVRAHANHIVLRTSINGGVSPSGNRSFNEVLERAWKAGRSTLLFTDEFRCPIPAPVTARATWELAQKATGGVYHLAGAQRLSRLEIGRLLASRHPQLNPKIEEGSIEDYDGPPRAADVSLDCAKVQSHLSFNLPGLAEWLESNPREPF